MASNAYVYTTLGQVEALTSLTFAADDSPSNTEASAIIEQVAQEINGTLRAAGYVLPITDTVDRNYLALFNRLGAAYRCWYAAVQGTDDHISPQTWREDYAKFLDDLRTGKVKLINTDPAAGDLTDLVSIPIDRVDGYSEEAETYTDYSTDTVIFRIV